MIPIGNVFINSNQVIYYDNKEVKSKFFTQLSIILLLEIKLTSAPVLSRITADTAGVDMRLFSPTQTRLTPLAAAIFVMICNKQKQCQLFPHFIGTWTLRLYLYKRHDHGRRQHKNYISTGF